MNNVAMYLRQKTIGYWRKNARPWPSAARRK